MEKMAQFIAEWVMGSSISSLQTVEEGVISIFGAQ